MQDVTSRYLVTFHGEKPVGMVHFQFVEEETMTDRDAEVAYWYGYIYPRQQCRPSACIGPSANSGPFSFEIQVVPEYQRRGIGAYLIDLLEAIGRAARMEKVMLTVFKGNGRMGCRREL